jgi:glucose-1-phosphate thymidylyltransferase
LGRGYAWFDAGTNDSLLETSEFVRVLQHRQGQSIACLEEIAFDLGFIGMTEIEAAIKAHGSSSYANSLRRLKLEG